MAEEYNPGGSYSNSTFSSQTPLLANYQTSNQFSTPGHLMRSCSQSATNSSNASNGSTGGCVNPSNMNCSSNIKPGITYSPRSRAPPMPLQTVGMASSFTTGTPTTPRWSSVSSPGYTPASLHTPSYNNQTYNNHQRPYYHHQLPYSMQPPHSATCGPYQSQHSHDLQQSHTMRGLNYRHHHHPSLELYSSPLMYHSQMHHQPASTTNASTVSAFPFPTVTYHQRHHSLYLYSQDNNELDNMDGDDNGSGLGVYGGHIIYNSTPTSGDATRRQPARTGGQSSSSESDDQSHELDEEETGSLDEDDNESASRSESVVTPHVDVVVCTCGAAASNAGRTVSPGSGSAVLPSSPVDGSVSKVPTNDNVSPLSHSTASGLSRRSSQANPIVLANVGNNTINAERLANHNADEETSALIIAGSSGNVPPFCERENYNAEATYINANVATSQHHQERPSAGSVSSSTVTMTGLLGGGRLGIRRGSCASTLSSGTGPICRFCHLPAEPDKLLISPCRCSGTLRFIHTICLTTWLEISMRKNRQKVPRCELCNFEYIRTKKFRLRQCRLPTVSRRDRILHLIFLCSFLLMLASAVTTILCISDRDHIHGSKKGVPPSLHLLDSYKETINRNPNLGESKQSHNGLVLNNLNSANNNQYPSSNDVNDIRFSTNQNNRNIGVPNMGISTSPQHSVPGRSQQPASPLTLEEGVTLACGILFFLAFFVGMTVQIKSRHTVYQLLIKLIRSNLVWEIQNYDASKDPMVISRNAAQLSASKTSSYPPCSGGDPPSGTLPHSAIASRSSSVIGASTHPSNRSSTGPPLLPRYFPPAVLPMFHSPPLDSSLSPSSSTPNHHHHHHQVMLEMTYNNPSGGGSLNVCNHGNLSACNHGNGMMGLGSLGRPGVHRIVSSTPHHQVWTQAAVYPTATRHA